jgi:tetratricopeptide (TPR) repeat protein
MKRHRWSGAQLARKVGASQPWVSMVLAGRRDPGFSRSAELLQRAGWELRLVPIQEDPVKRREFLLASASVTLIPATGTSPYSDPAYVDALTARLMHNEAEMGGAPLAREAMKHVARVSPAVGGRNAALQAAAARLCRQAALILHDVRRLDQAEEIATTALALARKAGDLAAQARIYDTLSLISAHRPDGRGVAYARRGLAVGDIASPDEALLSARLGRALALVSKHDREARATLERALDLSGECGPASATEIFGNAGIGFADLGLAEPAGDYLSTAIDLAGPQSPFVQSLYLSRQAKAAIRGRDPQASAQSMTRLAMVAPLVNSPRLDIHLRHIMDGTQRWAGIPEVRTAREHLAEVRA